VTTVAEAFSLALQHHQAGRVDQAEKLYQQILQADPNHADSHHLLGVVRYQTGRYAEAVASIQQALALNPWAAVFHSNLAVVYEALDDHQRALASFEQVLRIQPSAEAHNAVGNSLRAVGRVEESAAHCMQALRLRPDFCEAHDNLGNAFYLQGKLDQAVIQYREALRINHAYALAHGHLGLALADLGLIQEAFVHYAEALRLDPDNAEAHNNFTIVLLKEGKLDQAIEHSQRALSLKPRFAGALNNLSIALRRKGKLEEAIGHCRRALALSPQFPEAHNSLATALVRHASWAEALVHYHEAVRLKPNFAEARWNRSLLWLLLGDYEQGWPEYEWRWTQPGFTRRQFTEPTWDGSNLAGRTILLYAEQGLGDTLHFIRYAPLVSQRGGKVIVECQPALVCLLKSVQGIDQLIAEGTPLPPFDVQAAMFSLPAIFHTTIGNIPATVPYLHADDKLIEKWGVEINSRSRLTGGTDATTCSGPARQAGPTGDFKVGIAWQGSPTYGYDSQRSIPLAKFAPLAQIQGVQLISLQKGPGTEQLGALKEQIPVLDLGKELDESSGAFMDTAAVMKNLDLVICSDTAVPHLAGALGVPVWVALPHVPDWRWLLEREDSPWYATMRLFRQKQSGEWDDVFVRIAEELKKKLI
jgi:tetratricopeptide (TPR) repeat protein